jgi:2-polyprenyl-6-hydroxyphenyl methylase/3-demethylubiquinone-9 3-methyltransferase
MEKMSISSTFCRHFSSNTASVSTEEVTKFSEMNQTWWDPRKNPLIGMNPVRVEYIVESLKQHGITGDFDGRPLSHLKALDVGCGGGLLSESLARLGATVTAIDPSIPLVESAKQHSQRDLQTQSIDYRGGVTIEDLSGSLLQQDDDSDHQYDVICILDVIEHVADVDSMLRAASKLLKPDGILFCSTINKTLKSHMITIVGAEYVMGYLPVGTHDWNLFQSPQDVRERMKRAGLAEIGVSGMVMTHPRLDGTWAWRLEPTDTDINWIGSYRHDI